MEGQKKQKGIGMCYEKFTGCTTDRHHLESIKRARHEYNNIREEEHRNLNKNC